MMAISMTSTLPMRLAGAMAALLLITLPARASPNASIPCTVTILQPLGLTVSAPPTATLKERFVVVAQVTNQSAGELERVTVELLPPRFLTPMDALVRRDGTLGPDQRLDLSWRISAKKPGTYVILVTASGIDAASGQKLETAATALVVVK